MRAVRAADEGLLRMGMVDLRVVDQDEALGPWRNDSCPIHYWGRRWEQIRYRRYAKLLAIRAAHGAYSRSKRCVARPLTARVRSVRGSDIPYLVCGCAWALSLRALK